MAAKTIPFGSFNVGGGLVLDVTMTYDDVTLKVASFQWSNPGPTTTLTVTVNGTPFPRTIQPGPDSFIPGGSGITLVPSPKGGSPIFPFSVSVAPG